MIKQQMNMRVKQDKIFSTCKLKGSWKQKDKSQNFRSKENGSSITLTLQGGLTETLSFKKGADVFIKGDLIQYYDQDLL
ncbi:MAG: hypothetical protein K5790_05460 [Nitrosopumilus sp.]|uniref:hypothetical protein n=1 Tax=Nitrosopumilus sp. TaxID=2024843 RepID=UPI00247DAF68|nr:hypothetical protein [Nitrosopumilus sp.]MCV0392727.1 hypothetical protein [Nitrosopumilus sp.]